MSDFASSSLQKIAELAAMQPIEYERIRESEAEKLGMRVSVLDHEVGKARRATAPDAQRRRPAGDAQGGRPIEFDRITA